MPEFPKRLEVTGCGFGVLKAVIELKIEPGFVTAGVILAVVAAEMLENNGVLSKGTINLTDQSYPNPLPAVGDTLLVLVSTLSGVCARLIAAVEKLNSSGDFSSVESLLVEGTE